MLTNELLNSIDFKRMTPGRKLKFQRNCMIFACSKLGFPQRFMADVFALPHSRIAAILKEFRQYDSAFLESMMQKADDDEGDNRCPMDKLARVVPMSRVSSR